MNKKVLQIIAFTSFTISFFFGVLFVTSSSFIFAEAAPQINSITPSTISYNDIVVIEGNGFTGYGSSPPTSGVFIEGTGQIISSQDPVWFPPMAVQDWSDTKITVRFNYIPKAGPVSVFVKIPIEGVLTSSNKYTVQLNASSLAPQITELIPSSDIAWGQEWLTINGNNFGDNKSGGGRILFNGIEGCPNVQWSNTQLKCVPQNNRELFTDNKINKITIFAYDGSGWLQTDKNVSIDILSPCDNNSWFCGEWGTCSQSGQQTRTCNKISTCEGGVIPETSRTCTPPCTKDVWSCNEWSDCSGGGIQTRDCTKTFDCPTVTTPSPSTSQSCTPPCSADTWSCGEWSQCSSGGTQSRSCTKTFDCPSVYTPSPSTFQYCTPPLPPQPTCTADTWTCGAWNECSLSGIQSRSCSKTFDCSSVETAPPTTVQYCEAPNRPQQVPQDSSDGILNQETIIKSTVKLLCPVDAKRASQGSGTIIDPSGTILTNKHVVAGTLGCLVGFINNFNDEPYFGERHIADILKTSPDQDAAILKIRNPQNKKLPSVDITRGSDNLRLGTKISTYGFPAKFGTKITYTSGDFSGTDGSYLKTTAILEYGNSGGGAYLKDGTFIGVPSAVVRGELNALGYILSINTINAWLGNSSIVFDDTSNKYSRVSVLEDIDLKTLDSLKLFIPETDVTGDLVTPVMPATNQKTQKVTEQPQSIQTQEESTVMKSTDTNQEATPSQQNQTKPEKEQKPKVSWLKRFFLWILNIFKF